MKDKDPSSIQKDPSIVSRKIMDEVILVPTLQTVDDLKKIYTLNETGAFIWEHIDGQKKVKDLVELLAREFKVEPDQAREDLIIFVEKLHNIGALTIDS